MRRRPHCECVNLLDGALEIDNQLISAEQNLVHAVAVGVVHERVGAMPRRMDINGKIDMAVLPASPDFSGVGH